MRIFGLASACLLFGCASIQDLTRAECLPAGVPGIVVLKRAVYLYRFGNEKEISLWNSPYQYGSGLDDSGRMIMHSPPPLMVLPAGTRLTIEKITRESHFDSPPNSIYVRGVAHGEKRDVRFVYLWGINNTIQQAPWETETHHPGEFSRSVRCER